MTEQLFAAAIFVVMFVLIVMDKIERHIVTLSCGAATIVFVFGLCMKSMDAVRTTLGFKQIFDMDFWYHTGQASESSGGINWATIIFIAGMMIMVEGMSHAGFFNWLCMTIAKLVRYRPVPVLIAFMIVSAVLSMFIDSITVILFLAAVTTELAKIIRFNPVPVILAEIFCANLGGSATMCGDPPNIIIGTALGFSFMDFLANTGFIALISLVVVVFYFYFCFRRKLTEGMDYVPVGTDKMQAGLVIKDPKAFYISAAIFMLAVVLLVTHAQTGLTVAAIGVIIAVLTLISGGKNSAHMLKQLDYKTLLFFVGLFIVVGGLEQTGVLELIAEFIGRISGGDPMVMAAIIIWISGVASAFVDNIPFAATMIPVIKTLAMMQGADIHVLAWSLAMGTDIGGSATPIGASANVVGLSVLDQKGYKVTWGKYCLYMAPASLIVLFIANAFIWMRYF